MQYKVTKVFAQKEILLYLTYLITFFVQMILAGRE